MRDTAAGLFDNIAQPMAEVFERGEGVTDLETTIRTGDSVMRDFMVDLYPYVEDGSVKAVGLILKDVTELRRLEKEMRRLMDELQHRVKNTLATVNSIINQTINSTGNRAEMADTLKRRIGALAATHDLLTSGDWNGVSLQKILEFELEPYENTKRVKLHGPVVDLPPKHALALTLTLHELTTNAAKYGALSDKGETLDIDWAVKMDGAGREVTINWIEEVSTPIKTTPVVENFGMKLIKNAVKYDLRGKCEYALRPEGLNCRITVPF